MAIEFDHIFRPLQLRHRTLSSRINFGAHTANMAENQLPGDRHIGYYVERAIGGAGMIVVEPMPVHQTAVLTRGNFRPSDDSVIPHFRRLTESVHQAADTTILQQLYHVGQHGDADNSFAANWSPSGLPSYHNADGGHSMSELEIVEIIEGFVEAGRRAKASGFDGIELFAAYHSLIEQFWTPWSNRRTDRWGGSLVNRMRFGRMVIDGIRRACGDDFIIGLAVSIDPDSGASLSIHAVQEIVAWHDQRQLIDYVTCGTGSYFNFYKIMPTSLFDQRLGEPFAAALRSVVSSAVVQAESHMRTPENAESALAAGAADMVSIVRGQIADPHMVRKARAGQAMTIRPCISCNQMCWGRRSRDYFISCLVNPSAGREFQYGGDRFVPVADADRRTVTVVGGGPAGLEAARVAAERGHRVRLFEASPHLGGQWRLAGLQPSRSQITDHIAWYARELDRLGVDVHLDSYFDARANAVRSSTAADASNDRPFDDVVIIATGARPTRRGFQRAMPLVDALPGIGDGNVADITDVLADEVTPTGRVVLVDDLQDWRGIGTAILLQARGCQVTLVTAEPAAATGLTHSAADGPTRTRFARAGGVVIPYSVVGEWQPERATARLLSVQTGHESDIDADWLVVAEVATSNDELMGALTNAGHPSTLVAIGDAIAPRRAVMAIYEGRRLAMDL